MATGANISNYLENAIIQHFLRAGTAVTQPASLTCALFTDTAGTGTDQPATEVTGGLYARATGVTFSVGSNGVTSNSADITFPTANASWGTVNYAAIYDGSTNMLFWGPLTTPKAVASGDTFKILSGQFSITLD